MKEINPDAWKEAEEYLASQGMIMKRKPDSDDKPTGMYL
jgi:hypothetical protein